MYLLDETPENEPLREQVLNLLDSHTSENLALALELITGGGMHPSFILPLWVSYPNLPPAHKGTANALLKKSFAGKAHALKDESNLKFVVRNYSFDTFMRVFERLQSLYPAHCTTEKFALFFLPLLPQKAAFFDFFYEKLPAMRVFLLQQMQNSYAPNCLDFSDSSLPCLPAEVGEFPQLRMININNSSISELPESFYTLEKLRYFIYENTPLAQNEQILQTLTERMPALSAQYFYSEANNLYCDGYYKEASDEIKKAVELYANDDEFWRLYGEIHLEQKLFAEALEGFEQSLYLNSRSGYVFSKAAEAKCKCNLYKEALQMCETFLQNPTQFDYANKDESNIFLTQGSVLYHFEQYDACIVAYQKSIALCDYEETHYNLACAYSKKGDKTQMLKHLKEAIAQDGSRQYINSLRNKDKNFEAFYEDANFQSLFA